MNMFLLPKVEQGIYTEYRAMIDTILPFCYY